MVNQENWNKAWEAYCMECLTSFLVRRGLVACGLTNDANFEEIYRKPEFVSEHQGRSTNLYFLISSWYYYEKFLEPYGCYEALSRDDKDRIMLKLRNESIDPWIAFYLSSHDIGEIRSGDALDDGTPEHEESRLIEYEVMSDYFSLLPPPMSKPAFVFREGFENYDDSVTNLPLLAKAIDKVEAISFQLFLYTKGFVGDIMNKEPPSERDLRYAEILGTTRAADVWTMHYRVLFKNISPGTIEPANLFLETAFRNAYCDLLEDRQLPKCLTVDVTNID